MREESDSLTYFDNDQGKDQQDLDGIWIPEYSLFLIFFLISTKAK